MLLIQDAALWVAPVGVATTTLATFAAVRARRTRTDQQGQIEALQRRNDEMEEKARNLADMMEKVVAAHEGEARHLAEVRLPALLHALLQGHDGLAEDGGLLHRELDQAWTAVAYRSVLEQVATLPQDVTHQAEGAARSAVQTVARSFQALVNEQQAAITAMLDTQHDEKVLAYAIPIDHACSQLARRAQIVGLLTGMWPGRQRNDAPLRDVVRGGVSRIRDYLRVSITGERPEYVAGRYVEPVVLAVAELLDNGTRHSEPGTTVEVYFVAAHNGISIVIEDAGIGLKPEDRTSAARLLSGEHPVQLTELRTPPRFGFLAIGVLASQYGFRVSVEQESVHGGVRAVVHLPNALLTSAPPPAEQPSARPAAPVDQQPPPVPAQQQEEYPVADDGLPVRISSRANPRHAAQRPAATRPPDDAGSQVAAFVRGITSPSPSHPDQENP